MRTFEKSNKLENVLYDVRGPVVDEASRMEEMGLKILKLNIGNPAQHQIPQSALAGSQPPLGKGAFFANKPAVGL